MWAHLKNSKTNSNTTAPSVSKCVKINVSY